MTWSLQSVVCEHMVLTALSADRAVPTMIIHEFVDSTSYVSSSPHDVRLTHDFMDDAARTVLLTQQEKAAVC